MKQAKKTISANELNLKAMGKARREQEIALYGKPIHFSRTERDRTKYTRKQKHKGLQIA